MALQRNQNAGRLDCCRKKSCITFRVLVIGFFQRRADCTTSWYGPWKNRYLSFSFSFFALKGQDTKMRFSVEPPANSVRSSSTSACSSPSQQQPSSGDSSGFQQWHDAMRMVARLPGGVPPEFRRKVITYFLMSKDINKCFVGRITSTLGWRNPMASAAIFWPRRHKRPFWRFWAAFYIRQDSVPQYYGAARVQCMEYFSYYSIKVMYRLKTTTARAGYSSFSHLWFDI